MKNLLLLLALVLFSLASCTTTETDETLEEVQTVENCVNDLLGEWVNVQDTNLVLTFTDSTLLKNGELNSTYVWVEDCKRIYHESSVLDGVSFESEIHYLTPDTLTMENFTLTVTFSKIQ